MTSEQSRLDASSSTPSPRESDGLMGASLVLSAVVTWLGLCELWVVCSTYAKYRGRTDLDMPDWFDINMDLTFKVIAIAGLAGLLNLIAGFLSLGWMDRAGWAVRIGFWLNWLASSTLVGLLVWSRFPRA